MFEAPAITSTTAASPEASFRIASSYTSRIRRSTPCSRIRSSVGGTSPPSSPFGAGSLGAPRFFASALASAFASALASACAAAEEISTAPAPATPARNSRRPSPAFLMGHKYRHGWSQRRPAAVAPRAGRSAFNLQPSTVNRQPSTFVDVVVADGPEAISALDGVGVVAAARPLGKALEKLGVAAAQDQILGAQRQRQSGDHIGDVAAPLLLPVAFEAPEA